MGKKNRDLPEYVDVPWVAKRLGLSRQAIDKAGRAALYEDYRGDFLIPDAVNDGKPIWLKSRFGSDADASKD